MSMETVKQLAPHWIAMFVLMLSLLQLVEAVAGPLSIWASFALVIAVAIVYPSLVRALGIAPGAWT